MHTPLLWCDAKVVIARNPPIQGRRRTLPLRNKKLRAGLSAHVQRQIASVRIHYHSVEVQDGPVHRSRHRKDKYCCDE